MKIKYLVVFAIVLLVLTSACTLNNTKVIENNPKPPNTRILAGTTTPYIEFNKQDYQKALSENKIILLYFYANWCPLCKLEEPQTFAAFNELNKTDFIGFRVNYKDSDTDEDEVELAKEFGVTYQHTKVIIKNGQRVLKAPDSWDKDRYLEEIKKYA